MTTRTRNVVLAGLLVALFLAGVVSYYASSQPDGLNRVAIDKGFDKGEKAHALEDSPLAGYELKGVGNDRLSGGLAGLAGVALVFAVGGALTLALRRRESDEGSSKSAATASHGADGSRG